jgi:histidinol phosphatase-like PHP family hydrolase
MELSNAQIAELFTRVAEEQDQDHRRRALRRASRAAFFWPEEAADVVRADRPLTDLTAIGPWLARIVADWLVDPEGPEPPEPPPMQRGYLTLAEARATLADHPEWAAGLRGDLQMHTTYSDGRVPLREMVGTCAETYGYSFVAVTDHSQGLAVANGMDEARLAAEGADIDAVNRELEADGVAMRVLKGIEMNLSPEGEGDMDPRSLARLDLVLGAFHSKLRDTSDQTERYLAAVRNPTIHVLAHPRCRMFGRRRGLDADWPRVFAEAAAFDVALEVDAHASRQDLHAELLEVAREAGTMISIGTDAHHPSELAYMEFGLAAAIRGGIPRERILNFRPLQEVLRWAETKRTRRNP